MPPTLEPAPAPALHRFDLAPELAATLRWAKFGPGRIVRVIDGETAVFSSFGALQLVALDPTPQFPPQIIVVDGATSRKIPLPTMLGGGGGPDIAFRADCTKVVYRGDKKFLDTDSPLFEVDLATGAHVELCRGVYSSPAYLGDDRWVVLGDDKALVVLERTPSGTAAIATAKHSGFACHALLGRVILVIGPKTWTVFGFDDGALAKLGTIAIGTPKAFVYEADGHVWICNASTTPPVWSKLAGIEPKPAKRAKKT